MKYIGTMPLDEKMHDRGKPSPASDLEKYQIFAKKYKKNNK